MVKCLTGFIYNRGMLFRFLAINIIIAAVLVAYDPGLWKLALGFVMLNSLSLFFIMGTFWLKSNFLNKDRSSPVDSTIKIAHETLPYLRRGLNEETACKSAEIIKKISDVAAVAITDMERVLAYIGAGSDHHKAGGPIMTQATRESIEKGKVIVTDRKGLNCPVESCPLETAVVAPLSCKEKVVGTVKLYQVKEQGQMSPEIVKLASGMAQLLSMQMELAELDRQAQLVTCAELDALHAQINPHFLFNTLNTIIMFSRTNPETARRLLIKLASFFRQSLKRYGHFKTVKEELEYVHTYMFLVKARFSDKVRIKRDIDKEVLSYIIPVLSIQPLVENAVKHGVLPKTDKGRVYISVKMVKDEIFVVVKDDGVGIPEDKLTKVLVPGYGSGSGVGMSNVNERLKGLFGEKYGLQVISRPGKGTTVYFRIPAMLVESDKYLNRGGLANEA